MRPSRYVLALALCVAPRHARGDRAESPTDALDGWAIQASLQLGSGTQDRVVIIDGVPEVHDVSPARYGLAVRVWPIAGLYVGGEQSFHRLSNRTLDELEELDPDVVGFGDLSLAAGVVRRPTPSFIVGGGLRGTLPTGTAVYSYEDVQVEAHGLLGLSYTPRWDFYLQLRGGMRRGAEEDPRATRRGGFVGGFAYQRPRFFLLGHGFNDFHAGNRHYISTGGGVAFGWEITPGFTLSFHTSGSYTELHDMRGFEQVLHLSYTFFPDRRPQSLRQPDHRRGADWNWAPGRRASSPVLPPT